MKNFKSNDICEVKITSQPSLKYKPKAKPIKTLKSNDVFEEALFLLPMEPSFLPNGPNLLLTNATRSKEIFQHRISNSRKDLRSLNFVTIDGSNAKDFDDAVYAEESSDGYLLYVAIADVSEYVLQDSSLDKEALSRAPRFILKKKLSLCCQNLYQINFVR